MTRTARIIWIVVVVIITIFVSRAMWLLINPSQKASVPKVGAPKSDVSQEAPKSANPAPSPAPQPKTETPKTETPKTEASHKLAIVNAYITDVGGDYATVGVGVNRPNVKMELYQDGVLVKTVNSDVGAEAIKASGLKSETEYVFVVSVTADGENVMSGKLRAKTSPKPVVTTPAPTPATPTPAPTANPSPAPIPASVPRIGSHKVEGSGVWITIELPANEPIGRRVFVEQLHGDGNSSFYLIGTTGTSDLQANLRSKFPMTWRQFRVLIEDSAGHRIGPLEMNFVGFTSETYIVP